MRYICDATGSKTWFGIETEFEAATESDVMQHAVEKYFRKEKERATQTYQPTSAIYIEQEIGLKAHLLREMPLFLTLRSDDGTPLVTAMLPPRGREDRGSGRSSSGRATTIPIPIMPTRSARWRSISASFSTARAASPTAATSCFPLPC